MFALRAAPALRAEDCLLDLAPPYGLARRIRQWQWLSNDSSILGPYTVLSELQLTVYFLNLQAPVRIRLPMMPHSRQRGNKPQYPAILHATRGACQRQRSGYHETPRAILLHRPPRDTTRGMRVSAPSRSWGPRGGAHIGSSKQASRGASPREPPLLLSSAILASH